MGDLRHSFDPVFFSEEEKAQLAARLKAAAEQEDNMRDSTKRTIRHISHRIIIGGIAAALLTVSAAAAVIGGGLLGYWNGTPDDMKRMTDGMVYINQGHTYENGWSITVQQAAADRYSLAVLVDIAAPEGITLQGEEYGPDFFMDISPRWKEDGVSASTSGSQWIADSNPTDNHVSYVWYSGAITSTVGMQPFIGRTVTLKPQSLLQWGVGSVVDFSEEGISWTFQLPNEDCGFTVPGELEVRTDTRLITVKKLYLSPVSLSLQLEGDIGGLGKDCFHLILADGENISMNYISIMTNQETGNFVFCLDRMVDPAQVDSILVNGVRVELPETET